MHHAFRVTDAVRDLNSRFTIDRKRNDHLTFLNASHTSSEECQIQQKVHQKRSWINRPFSGLGDRAVQSLGSESMVTRNNLRENSYSNRCIGNNLMNKLLRFSMKCIIKKDLFDSLPSKVDCETLGWPLGAVIFHPSRPTTVRCEPQSAPPTRIDCRCWTHQLLIIVRMCLQCISHGRATTVSSRNEGTLYSLAELRMGRTDPYLYLSIPNSRWTWCKSRKVSFFCHAA